MVLEHVPVSVPAFPLSQHSATPRKSQLSTYSSTNFKSVLLPDCSLNNVTEKSGTPVDKNT